MQRKKGFFNLKMLAEFFSMPHKNAKNNQFFTFFMLMNKIQKGKKMHAETFFAS
jgi:hypothetical protein